MPTLGAQTNTLEITIGDKTDSTVRSKTFLFNHYINQKRLIDSISSGNYVQMQLNDELPHGLYSVMLYTNLKDDEGKFQRLGFDLIISGHDIELTICITENNILGNVAATKGENMAYYSYYNQSQLLKKKHGVLSTTLEQYPANDEFYDDLSAQLVKLEQDQSALFKSISSTSKELVAQYYLLTQSSIEKHDIENIDFSNPLLKNSPFIPIAIWSCLDEVNRREVDKRISRLDDLLSKLRSDDEVHRLMLDELITYYERRGLNEIVVHLNKEHLLPSVCENTNMTKKIEEKNLVLQRLLVGKIAPDILLTNKEEAKKLHDVEAQVSLLLFWESTCYHCQNLMSELRAVYGAGKEFEVIAWGLDTSKAVYTAYLESNPMPWSSYTDHKGWEGQAIIDYNVVATPSMFLLDDKKTIIARPVSIQQLRRSIATNNGY